MEARCFWPASGGGGHASFCLNKSFSCGLSRASFSSTSSSLHFFLPPCPPPELPPLVLPPSHISFSCTSSPACLHFGLSSSSPALPPSALPLPHISSLTLPLQHFLFHTFSFGLSSSPQLFPPALLPSALPPPHTSSPALPPMHFLFPTLPSLALPPPHNSSPQKFSLQPFLYPPTPPPALPLPHFLSSTSSYALPLPHTSSFGPFSAPHFPSSTSSYALPLLVLPPPCLPPSHMAREPRPRGCPSQLSVRSSPPTQKGSLFSKQPLFTSSVPLILLRGPQHNLFLRI